jgi:hypothetical protein
MHRDTDVVNHVDDIFDLLGIDYAVRQMIIDLSVGQIALLLAAGDQIFELLCLLVAANYGGFVLQDAWPFMLLGERSDGTVLTEFHLQRSLGNGNWFAH